MLKSNFKLVVRKFVRCFIAVQNFKKFGRFIFFQIRIDFLRKSSNFNFNLGSRMQIRYTHKLSMHKADFSQNREVCAMF